jgi:hypothetical protein
MTLLLLFVLACAKEVPMASSATPAPFACQMDALTPDERERSRLLREELVAETRGVVEVGDGYRFSYPGEAFVKTAEWVALERRCCPFLDFAIEWREGNDALVVLSITGRDGVKDFLRAEMPELPQG